MHALIVLIMKTAMHIIQLEMADEFTFPNLSLAAYVNACKTSEPALANSLWSPSTKRFKNHTCSIIRNRKFRGGFGALAGS